MMRGRVEKRLQRLTVHRVPVSGTTRGSFALGRVSGDVQTVYVLP
ncbi:hypothetical protein [Clavibacter tessellarius]